MPNRTKFKQYYDSRAIIKDIMIKDLVGPIYKNEVIIESPSQYYTMGKLYPITNDQNFVDIARTAGIESEVDSYDTSLATTNMRNPSSMGITCTIKPHTENIALDVDFGMYIQYSSDKIKDENIDITRWKDDINNDTVFWVRKSYSLVKVFSLDNSINEEIHPGVFLKGFVHKTFENGEKLLTVVLINKVLCKDDNQLINGNMIFQPKIKIHSDNIEKKNIFVGMNRQVEISEESEILNMNMLYSDYQSYGQGHGCSISWGNSDEIEIAEPEYIESTFIPEHNLKQMKALEISESPIFSMKYIIESDPLDVISELNSFANNYLNWINDNRNESKAIKVDWYDAAKSNLIKCEDTYDRLKYSINMLNESLSSDKLVWRAFVYANEAMLLQRQQLLERQHIKPDIYEIKWYPFQLAFFVQELRSLIEPESQERKIVDLLWFPTGGGKTEAYLGIAAFTIFYRRMKYGDSGDGVSVIMRYTLRLLTIQQFERASMLICACEILRDKYKVSKNRIEIGLWVGNELTPKNIKIAQKSLNKLKVNAQLSSDDPDPCQVKVCPWCGNEISYDNYHIDNIHNLMNITCSNALCYFSKDSGLPIRLTDEEIYNLKPTFIVATVDKFAQIAFNSEAGEIFAIGSNLRAPELIIQDELHLISGPLGTMTGIYEAAITTICEKDKTPIKIIASTATIRNAKNQIKALYGREFSQFPPQGISIDDSFFAQKSNEYEKPARLYLGIMGIGTSFTTTLIRVYASWLFASRYLIDLGFDDKVIDNFWTLTGYFNSLRELGGTRTQVVDDVQSRYQHLKDRKFAHLMPRFTGNNRYEYSEELTSRLGNDRISEIIQKDLKKSFSRENNVDVYDFILASNMISVGVDIGRLGTMAVAGQPKTNSEYIQATSRVGRDNPGVVFTIYNPSRSRDRSHYEQFLRYHSALYRYVEATSLTPFSDRARDRGLHTLFVILCRYLVKGLRLNEQAGNFKRDQEEIIEIQKIIIDYVNKVDPDESVNVMNELQDIIEKWDEEAQGELYYRKVGKKSLLKNDIEEEDRFRTMNSMRSVEQQSGIFLLGGQ